MIRQIVLVRLSPDAPADAVPKMAAALLALRAEFSQIEDMCVGEDLRVRPDNYDFGYTADFATVDDYLAFREDERHWETIRTAVTPYLAERAGVVMEIPDPADP
ncbi:Dabb family protein [Streptomyces marispadix]|uniref:Dabb family protein n=1 Tax=Streptomyces marispadix TaxID=2922868 RepID=A0ABS9T5P8_9ACTN|nr:Dabb family protein [Streptomyces marispadix]MCH6163847.1 Dabb family protein [Streptomyces marispadix]